MTNQQTFQDAVVPYITLENALTYDDQMDKWLWVVDNIIDPLELKTTDARVNWIEDRFVELIEANIEKWAVFHLNQAHAAGFNY
jgi:hypothetical protein